MGALQDLKKADVGLASPESYSAHRVKLQADIFMEQGFPIIATVLESIASRFLKGGDREVAELLARSDQDILNEVENSFYKTLN